MYYILLTQILQLTAKPARRADESPFEGLTEMPILNDVIQQANQDEVAFLSITYDNAEIVNNLHKVRPFSFDKIVEAKALVDQFKITGYPKTIVVDKNGIVQHIFRGGIYKAKDLQEVIARVQKNQYAKIRSSAFLEIGILS